MAPTRATNRDGHKALLQIYRVASCDARPQAETPLLTTDLTADGHRELHLATEPVGTHLLATLTTPARGTSKYSHCVTVTASH